MKKIILILSGIMLSYYTYAQQVSQNEAINAALNTLLYQTRNSELSRQDVDTVYTKVHNDNVVLYEVLFRTGESVLLSGHKACKPVLGYISKEYDKPTDGILYGQSIPEGLFFFIENYALQVDSCFQNYSFPYYQQEWEDLQFFNENRNLNNVNQVNPLLFTHWGQTSSNDGCIYAYNYSIPGCSTYLHCPAGCAAVAMGQILKKWNFPESIPSTCKVYEWNFMPESLMCNNNNPQYYTQCQVVSQFLYDCGTSIGTSYCGYNCDENQSYAFPSNVPAGLNSFGYDNAGIIYKSNYTQTAWDSILIQDLLKGYPIFYSGSGNQGGHAFVCDGYDGNGLFHFNWGWNGNYNGYYYTGNLSVGNFKFSNNQSIVYNIHPKECWDNIIMECDKNIVRKSVLFKTSNLFSNNNHSFIIRLEAHVIIQAENEILLSDGFSVEESSSLTAIIAPCGTDKGTNRWERENVVETSIVDSMDILMGLEVARQKTTEVNNKMLLFPNPASQSFAINFTETQESLKQVRVFDVLGKEVLSIENPSSNTINIANLPAGIYVVRVLSQSGKTHLTKLVKE